jgi:hypothetical protein
MLSMTTRSATSERQAGDHVQQDGARKPLVLVRGSRPGVVRTFAESAETVRTWVRLRRVEWSVPSGLVHAAELHADVTLCGTPLTSLEEFGRSRFPFERISPEDRCSTCDDAAGNPSA